MKAVFIIILLSSSFLSGCFYVPQQEKLNTNKGIRLVDRCPSAVPTLQQPKTNQPYTFSVASWNIYKFKLVQSLPEVKKLTQQYDFVLLQEDISHKNVTDMLNDAGLNWQQSVAFEFEDQDAGVMTASKLPSLYTCAYRSAEPAVRIPKSVLVSVFPLPGSNYPLLMINLHGLNFELGIAAYQKQLKSAFTMAKKYPGPVVFSGDFNSWGDKRAAYLQQSAQLAGLKEAIPQPDVRIVVLNQPIDHLYFKGLTLKESRSIRSSASDHNPIFATFEVTH